MPRYLNASQAARELGVPDKTIRRWLKQGLKGRWKLTAKRTESGQLLISEADIKRIKQGREQDRLQYISGTSLVPSEVSTPNQDLAELSQQVALLTAKVSQLEERIAVLEHTPQSTPNHNETALVMPSPTPTYDVPTSRERPVRATTPRKEDIAGKQEDLPPGMLSAVDFAEKLGIPYTVLDGYIRRGVRGERLDVTEVPHPTRAGYSHKYFSLEQQEKTIALLRKLGKLKDE